METRKWTAVLNALTFAVVTNCIICYAGVAQRVPEIVLRPANGVSLQHFSGITSVRELEDGRLLVADRVEQILAVLDWQSGRATTIGRSGEGPAEYNGAGWLFALRGDSTLFVEWPNTRRHLLEADRIVVTRPLREDFGGLRYLQIEGTDAATGVLGVVGVFGRDARFTTTSAADSLMILLVDRASERVDTVGRVKGRGGVGMNVVAPRGGKPGRIILSNPLVSEEQAVLFPDGWIAVAHLDPYRVDWRTAGGSWIRGAPLPFELVEVDEGQKCTVVERVLGLEEEDCDPSFLQDWPKVVPAFLPTLKTRTLLTAPDGNVVIARTPAANSTGNEYDVVSRDGRLVGRLKVPFAEKVVGFGRSAVYVTATDDLGLQTIRRHPW